MRKLALLLAAALFVSAPLVAATSTPSYAAAKKPAKAPKAAPKAGGAGAATPAVATTNNAFLQALADLGASLVRPLPPPAPAAPAARVRAKKKA